MNGYLDLARRIRATQCGSRKESRSRLESEAAKNAQAPTQNGALRLTPEGRKLKAAGFKPKERCGKIIWQSPDTGFWFSQEVTLLLLEREMIEEDRRT